MGIGITHTILLLLVVSSVAIYLPHARGCGGSCSLGSSSYDFLGDPAVNIDMSSPDEFVRENLGNRQTTLSVKSLLAGTPTNNSSSLNQTNKGNASQNSSGVLRVIDRPENKTSDNTIPDNTTSDNRIVKLGATGMQDKRISTLTLNTFNNIMFQRRPLCG